MKTLKIAFIALTLFTTSLTVGAATKEDVSPSGQYKVINTYVDAITRGRLTGFDGVTDNSAKFKVLRNNQIQSFTKDDMISYLKENEGREQQCTIATEVVSSNDDVAVIKVEQKYAGLTRTNYVTLANNGKEWKITDVYSIFK
ncbi:nuclear transport factor 2 family protein [Mucilaginibacter ginkgonis]|uniref:Nuclear transport factor 2 family protein n=1 Tax=Mucilaginibacter ginkgonis TaxID=2682091 RepID=A0A6I4HVI1_9SPHI|nr:nuclear transport factor 2 family protein [Mucilaginibacter ginkgonis]QQL49829.1 nuclear transport factor 2 family protein [Mucilaginibacter ginkgonis]